MLNTTFYAQYGNISCIVYKWHSWSRLDYIYYCDAMRTRKYDIVFSRYSYLNATMKCDFYTVNYLVMQAIAIENFVDTFLLVYQITDHAIVSVALRYMSAHSCCLWISFQCINLALRPILVLFLFFSCYVLYTGNPVIHRHRFAPN